MGAGAVNRLFVFGLGYSAMAVGALLLERGWTVAGTIRAGARAQTLAGKGFVPILFNDAAAVNEALTLATHLLISTPPSDGGDPTLAAYGAAIREAQAVAWIGYLSTIGVYGDHRGGWVDESTPPSAAAPRAAARIEAEKAWTALANERGLSLDIFRLAGIYGPGRSPLDRIRSGDARRIVKPGQVFNRIHVDDIAQVVAAAMVQNRRDASLRIFNVADDEPAPPQDVVAYAAALLGAKLPPEIPFDTAELSPMARSFYEDNKRIRNDKIKRDLGISLRYPTFREGLHHLAKT
jgi:nucleoside-diphosphate-sugar epimerase